MLKKNACAKGTRPSKQQNGQQKLYQLFPVPFFAVLFTVLCYASALVA
jgi:hypothetical protein